MMRTGRPRSQNPFGTIRDIIQQTETGFVVPAHMNYNAYVNVWSERIAAKAALVRNFAL